MIKNIYKHLKLSFEMGFFGAVYDAFLLLLSLKIYHRIRVKVMKEGEEMPHGPKAHTKRLQIDDKEVEVRFIRLENGTTRIGSAWIRTVKEK